MGQLEEPRTQSAARCWLTMILQDAQLRDFHSVHFFDRSLIMCEKNVSLNHVFLFMYRENELECILFGEAASEAALTVEAVEGTSLVVVLNLARLTWTDDSTFESH